MQTLDFFTYFSGMSAAFYLMASLVCGLLLSFSHFSFRTNSILVLSRSLGIILLLGSCSTICYILGNFLPHEEALFLAASTIDFFVFAGLAILGYHIYSDNQPDKRTHSALTMPFLAIAVVNVTIAASRPFLLDAAMLILITEYVFYALSIRRGECALEHKYSNSDAHSLKWIRTVTLLSIGWWAIRFIFIHSGITVWYDSALYIYLAILALFSYIKVLGYGAPVMRETRQQDGTMPESSIPHQQRLIGLLEEQEIYLKSDLTIEDVAMELGTTPQYLSIMLHDDMNTSFTQIINKYRVERAMLLLKTTDDKVANIGYSCGFNSQQVFNRTFAKVSGQTPSAWRNSLK